MSPMRLPLCPKLIRTAFSFQPRNFFVLLSCQRRKFKMKLSITIYILYYYFIFVKSIKTLLKTQFLTTQNLAFVTHKMQNRGYRSYYTHPSITALSIPYVSTVLSALFVYFLHYLIKLIISSFYCKSVDI